MKIAMIGLGQVAQADALALARLHEVVLTGPVPERVEAINAGVFTLDDPGLGAYLAQHPLCLRATLDTRAALEGAGMVMVSAPLSRDPETEPLRLIELDSRIELVARLMPLVPIVIRSAVPVGFTDGLRTRLGGARLVFAPEFSRPGAGLRDLLHPEVLIVGARGQIGAQVADLLASAAMRTDVPRRLMGAAEAEVLRHLSILVAGHAACTQPDAVMPATERQATALADALQARGARIVGFYLGAGWPACDSVIAQLRAALERFGLQTPLHVVGAGDLARFKAQCDVVIAPRVTPDLRDILDKLVTRADLVA